MSPLLSQLTQVLCFVTIGFLLGVLVTYTWFTWVKPGRNIKELNDRLSVDNSKTIPSVGETPGGENLNRETDNIAGNNPEMRLKKQPDPRITAPGVTVKTGSMVAQIDEILQEMIIERGLGNYGLRMTEDASHGVVVWLGLEKYDGLTAVPDPEVQSLIKEAVVEWQRRAAEIH